jgi:hypothetical protein
MPCGGLACHPFASSPTGWRLQDFAIEGTEAADLAEVRLGPGATAHQAAAGIDATIELRWVDEVEALHRREGQRRGETARGPLRLQAAGGAGAAVRPRLPALA